MAGFLLLPGELRMAVWKARSASPVQQRVKDSNRSCAPHGPAPRPTGHHRRPRDPPAQRILPEQRLHLGAGIGLGRRRLLGLLHEAVFVVLVDVEAAEAGGERAPRHGPARPQETAPPTGTGTGTGARPAPPRVTHTPRRENTTEPGKNPNNDFNVQIPSLQQVRGSNRDPEENGTNRGRGTALGPLYRDPGTLGKGWLGLQGQPRPRRTPGADFAAEIS